MASTTIGFQSYIGKDFNPMERRINFLHCSGMQLDPFIRGLALVFQARPDLKPAPTATAAGLDNSTIRKMLAGQTSSPKVETAEKIANVVGLPLSAIIALGERADGPDIVNLAQRISKLDSETQREIEGFLAVKLGATQTQSQG